MLQRLSPSTTSVVVDQQTIRPVRNLGVDFDSEMTMRAHIAKTTQTCFFISDVYARSVGCWGVMLPVHLSRRSFVLIRV